jgi:hypothetical protein
MMQYDMQIRDETQTKIDLPAEGEKSDVITITGKKENVDEARDRIQKIQNELVSSVSHNLCSPAFRHFRKRNYVIYSYVCAYCLHSLPHGILKQVGVTFKDFSSDIYIYQTLTLSNHDLRYLLIIMLILGFGVFAQCKKLQNRESVLITR